MSRIAPAMVAAFSPHCDGGGPIHLHSPTRIHHVDASSAIRQLRRSLSRSPSKQSDHRHLLSRSHSPSQPGTPFSPSPLSPRRTASDQVVIHSIHSPSPLATPIPPSARVNRPTMRRGTPAQSNSKLRSPPRSPSKGILAESKNHSNSQQIAFALRDPDQLMLDRPLFSVDDNKENSIAESHEAMPRIHLTKSEKRRSGNFSSMIAASSPLKRSDGIMDLDQASRGSPSAKRRSLHGPSFSPADFNVLDHELKAEEPRRRSEEGEIFALPGSPSSSHLSSIPKRSSSLRKSTLQQRQYERPSQTNSKSRQRMSLDSFMPPSQRESPFSSQGPLLNASIHPIGSQQNSQPHNAPHPLHQTMTQSSSNSSIGDDSPTHEPIHRSQRPKSMYDFSKSLPIGASRPLQEASFSTEAEGNPSQGSFETPSSYKFAKPYLGAFMSTGLVSKKNRNVDEVNGGLPKAQMPDTPCKRPTTIFSFENADPPGTSKPPKSVRHSFGSPSTPLNVGESKPRKFALSFAKKSSIFGSQGNKQILQRKTSFASIDTEDVSRGNSPIAQPDSQSTDSELPNTPTKYTVSHGFKAPTTARSFSRGQSFSSDDYEETQRLPTDPDIAQSKLSPLGKSPDSYDEDSDSVMGNSPSATFHSDSSLSVVAAPPSCARTRLLRNLKSPTPVSRRDFSVTPSAVTPIAPRTKMHSLSPASPLQNKSERLSPHTPQESLLPPDPSRLSISGHNEKTYFVHGSSSAPAPPATPTASTDKRASLAIPEADPCLKERFAKTELIGTGEFSLVYKVTQPPEISPGRSLFSATPVRSSPRTPAPEKVWAVKKTKHPYASRNDRREKTSEVDILKALGQSDHLVLFVDSWEDQNYLYIQTEFCEEGSLDKFLEQVGLKGRLDDFRIWKILLELSLVCQVYLTLLGTANI